MLSTFNNQYELKEEIIAYQCGKDGWAVGTDKIISSTKTNILPCDLPNIDNTERIIIYEKETTSKCPKNYIKLHLFNNHYVPIKIKDNKIHEYCVALINTFDHINDYINITKNIDKNNFCVLKPLNMELITEFKVK
tara:strand:- start:890 stop:1297 length:408 start_codon:yes stop_codon:yes gene_type:complete